MAPVRKKQRLSNGDADGLVPAVEASEIPTGVDEPENAASSQEKAVQQKRSLFVRSLPTSTTSESLTELFSDSYPVKHAVAVTDPATKECRGYGFVTFADAEDATRAKEQFNGHLLDGKKLRIELAEPRHRGAEGTTDGSDKTKPGREEQPLPPKIIVRNLPWSIKGSKELTRLFQSYGKVKQAYVPKKGPGLMAGFGFVIMRGKKNAEKAIEGVNGKEVDGRTLAVDWAVEKGVYQDLLHKEDGKEEDSAVDDGLEGSSDEESASDLDDTENEDEDTDATSDGDEQDSEGSDEDGGVDLDDEDDGAEQKTHDPEDRSTTIFVRNLPFTCTDEDLEDHFSQFGSTRYARVVMDHGTERSKGTGFVCFYDKDAAEACLRDAPSRVAPNPQDQKGKDPKAAQPGPSILQNESTDPTGRYTLEGRVLQISRAVDKREAGRLAEEGLTQRYKRDNDKRRLYLLSEGTINSRSKLWESLPPSEQAMRESSAKQRKTLIESNPSLHLSLTRLSVRNVPRSVTSKELKELARQAVVGFASDVKEGKRQKLSKEEILRGGEEMLAAEKARKKAGKGIVKQAKVVFESAGGSKVAEDSGAGRSRGYGFIEYHTHRNALMGLRWLNGHAIGYKVQGGKDEKGKLNREDIQDRKKRLIVEFAIENAQVVRRRQESEQKARTRSQAVSDGLAKSEKPVRPKFKAGAKGKGEKPGSRKRKRDSDDAQAEQPKNGKESASGSSKKSVDEKLAQRNRVIGKKRAMRKARKGGKS